MMTKQRSDLDRVLSRVIRVDDCWEWQGYRNNRGYGSTHSGSVTDGTFRKHHLVHRLVYESMVGPIPDDLVIDHLCRNRACCNPAHLEPVSQGENLRRGEHYERTKSRCDAGHSLEDAYRGRKPGYRRCRTCTDQVNRRGDRRRRAATKEATAT